MAADRDAGVDPRFDPQFQRGYDPSKHRTPRVPRAERREPREDVPIPEVGPTVVENVPSASGDGVAEERVVPRRNPFRLILLLASLAAIAGAALLLWRRIETDPYGGYGGYAGDVTRIFLDQFSDASLAPLLTGGLLGLCLWIALGALRARDRG
jgi:hypothetical protein